MHMRIAILALVVASLALAQSEAGSATLNGTVVDPSGASIPGARLTVVNSDTGLTRETRASEAGLYSFPRLPAGRYELSAEMPGFKITKRSDLRLNVGAVLTLDIPLEVGGPTEQVTVTTEAPVVETTRSQTSTVVNEKSVRDLPINGRNFLDFALLTPGVVRDPRGGDLSFGGQRGTANSLLVDGGDSNNLFFGQSSGRAGTRNPYSFSQDAVQEFQVNTSSYTAEQGRAGGGIINVITKSGSNEVHGTAFWFFRDRAMNANTFLNNQRGIARQPYHFNQFGGNIGGPAVKDQVFFFFNYDGQRNTNPNPVFLTIGPNASDPLSVQGYNELLRYSTGYTRKFDNNIYTGKIDWNIATNQNFSVRYNAHRFEGANLENSGTASAFEHTGNSNVTTDNLAAAYTRVFGANMVWDARFIYLRDDQPGSANSDAPEAVIRQNNVVVMQIGRNNFSPRYTNTRRYQTVQSLSLTHGTHTFKFGGDLNLERIDNFFPGLFSGSYQFNSYADFAARRPFSFTQAFAGPDTTGPLTQPDINEFAFYAQDSWRATGRLTLNYGVRYDLMDSRDPRVGNPDPLLIAAGLRTDRMNLDTNNFAGRFGFAYKLGQAARFVLRGGIGTYYARTPAILTGTAHSQNGIQVRTYELRTGLPDYPRVLPAVPAGVTVRPNIYVLAPDFVQPQTHQWSLNLETGLLRDTALTFGYLGVRGIHLARTRDINLFPAELVSGVIAGGGAVPFYRHPGAAGPARPNPNFGRISLFESGGDSIYHGGFVQLTKRYSANVQFLGSYTWSKVIDTAPEATTVVVGADDSKLTQNMLLPNLDRASGDADIRHRFVFSGVWDVVYARSLAHPVARALLRDYQLSLIANVQSGRYFSATVSGDPNNDSTTASDRPFFTGRNTIEGPGFASVDARISRDIPLYQERANLRLIVEAFNLTNRANFTAFNRGEFTFNAATRVFTPAPNYLARTGTADPRILQVAVRITF